MNSYGIKVTGTEDEKKLIEEVFKKKGFAGKLNDEGIINIDEDYAFSIMDQIVTAAMEMVSVAPNACFIFRGFMDDE